MISIIVPVYKTEKFLRQCLDSILQQTFNDWEMWIVDDGSPDNSPAICDEYAAKDKRIKVIHQNNQGTAMAKNNAIRKCNGDMVYFVDSDDWLEPDALASLADTMQKTNADMVVYEHIVEEEKKSVIKGNNDGSVTILNREETLWKIFTNEMPSYLWLTLFKREIISLFPDMRSFEDHGTFFSWASNARTTAYLSRALYHYRMNPDSLLQASQEPQPADVQSHKHSHVGHKGEAPLSRPSGRVQGNICEQRHQGGKRHCPLTYILRREVEVGGRSVGRVA